MSRRATRRGGGKTNRDSARSERGALTHRLRGLRDHHERNAQRLAARRPEKARVERVISTLHMLRDHERHKYACAREMYRDFDDQKRGFLSAGDFKRALRARGLTKHLREGEGEIDYLFDVIDENGDRHLEWREFSHLLDHPEQLKGPRTARPVPRPELTGERKRHIDLVKEELLSKIMQTTERSSAREIARAICRRGDGQSSAFISYAEFRDAFGPLAFDVRTDPGDVEYLIACCDPQGHGEINATTMLHVLGDTPPAHPLHESRDRNLGHLRAKAEGSRDAQARIFLPPVASPVATGRRRSNPLSQRRRGDTPEHYEALERKRGLMIPGPDPAPAPASPTPRPAQTPGPAPATTTTKVLQKAASSAEVFRDIEESQHRSCPTRWSASPEVVPTWDRVGVGGHNGVPTDSSWFEPEAARLATKADAPLPAAREREAKLGTHAARQARMRSSKNGYEARLRASGDSQQELLDARRAARAAHQLRYLEAVQREGDILSMALIRSEGS